MLDLGSWSFGRVMLASALWVVLVVGAAAAGIYLIVYRPWAAPGSDGIGAVGMGASLLDVLAILFGPPVVLILVWLYRRGRR